MPLLKRKSFPLAELPNDLEPHELVYQVRYTEEIFRDYDEYLNRINLYRQRVWMCKGSGKTNLTYEEALLSEERATEKVQQFPKELMEPALQIIQYSMLSLKDLADMVAAKLQERLYVGAEMYGRKDDGMYPCKISKVIEDDVGKIEYEVAWLDKNKEVMEYSILNGEDLEQKKVLFSRNFLKSFIRESTYRSAPWVLHDKLAESYGISTIVPENLRSMVSFKDGLLVCNKRRKNEEGTKHELENTGKKVDGSSAESNVVEEGDEPAEEPIKYPIDDLLVQPDADDPVFSDRPSPSRDFNVLMECVGDLLMVWDFCSSFGRLLHLWPFSLEDFENAICHDKGNLILLVETHAALLRLLIKDNGQYFSAVRKRNRNLKITLITWTEYLCDFLEMMNIPELCAYIATIKRGHYGLLDVRAKLGIFRELVNHALETNIVREKLDEFVEQRQALGATRRGEALAEARKKREEKEHLRAVSDANQVAGLGSKESASANGNHIVQNGDIVKKQNGEIRSQRQDRAWQKSKQMDTAPKKMARKQNVEVKVPTPNGKDLSEKEALECSTDDRKEVIGKKKQRREYYEREIEKRFIRTTPLGKDRNYNRYWWFQRDGRIFVESSDSKHWGYYSCKEELDLFIRSLNCKGERERALKKQLEKFNSRICLEMEKRSKEFAQKVALEEAVLRRSSRVRAPPRKNPANAFLEYVNKWKDD